MEDDSIDFSAIDSKAYITGTALNYFLLCRRKLWLFANGIHCEQESDAVALGRLLHENTYRDEKKEFEFGSVKIDWLDLKNKVIHEVKKSDKAEYAHAWQLKYYIYYFKTHNIGEFTGELDYPKLKKKETVTLSDSDTILIEQMIEEIKNIVSLPAPPELPDKLTICKKCSYFELCMI
jgi:CRISPR-associated exonuclease Cas4